jgi:2-polyprenyl-3-methyl-5-hydroxy-6-metoxy-1,4-benzoquinol methylase
LKLDILPILIYGAGQISAKKQAFYIKSGIVATKTMQRVKHGDTSFGDTYQEQSKKIRQWYVEQYTMFNNELGRASNAYFRDAITKNYIYKGSSLEREIRNRCHIDGYYGLWDRLIPRRARIVDIGCGYGQQSFMLGLLSPERTILGIDSDMSKVEVAQHSFLCKKTNVKFICADVVDTSYSAADAILLGEFIHSTDTETQSQIMKQASEKLNENGIIAIRGLRQNTCDTSAPDWINQFAQENCMSVTCHNDEKYKSATLYTLTTI